MVVTVAATSMAGITISHLRRQAMLNTSSGVYCLPGIKRIPHVGHDRDPDHEPSRCSLARKIRNALHGAGPARDVIVVVRVLPVDAQVTDQTRLHTRGGAVGGERVRTVEPDRATRIGDTRLPTD